MHCTVPARSRVRNSPRYAAVMSWMVCRYPRGVKTECLRVVAFMELGWAEREGEELGVSSEVNGRKGSLHHKQRVSSQVRQAHQIDLNKDEDFLPSI